MPTPDIIGTIHARLHNELRALLGPTAPGPTGLMQFHQTGPAHVAALYHLPSGRHAVIGWRSEHVERSLHPAGEAGYLDALDQFCILTGLPALDTRLVRRRQEAGIQ